MSKKISHIGKVAAIGEGEISVWVERGEACASCQSKKFCTMFGSSEQTMKIKDRNSGNYTVGEKVSVSINASLGIKAVLLAYILPLTILLLSFAFGFYFFSSELLQIAIALTLTVFYYILLYKFRHKIEQRFTFSVSKT